MYSMYVSMLDEEELECLTYAQRLRRYANRKVPTAPQASPTTDTDERKPALNKRGGIIVIIIITVHNAQGQVIDVDIEPTSPDETPH